MNTKILILGKNGVGKSSTVNALLKADLAKVEDSEACTKKLEKFSNEEFEIFDSCGFQGLEKLDKENFEEIKNLLDKENINVILLVEDSKGRDLGFAYYLIKELAKINKKNIPLILVLNKASLAMSGRAWNFDLNQPEEKLKEFLEERAKVTQERILEATGEKIRLPLYYDAGFKDDYESQEAYNIEKLKEEIQKVSKNSKPKQELTLWIKILNFCKNIFKGKA